MNTGCGEVNGYPGTEHFMFAHKITIAFVFVSMLGTLLPTLKQCSADTVEISGGGHVSGSVKRVSETKVPYVVVEVDSDIRVAIPESRVRRVVTSDELAEYRRRAAIAGNDAELNYELARWCSGKYLTAQFRYHMQRAITLKPDHAYARAALNYVQDNGQWVKHADLQRSRGMISVGGVWQLPEVVAIQKTQEENEIASKKWIKDIARLRSQFMTGGKAGPEAFATISAIEDPLAASAIAGELMDSRRPNKVQPRQLRQLWIKLLGRFENMVAVEALVRTGVEENDDVIREAALEQLQQYGAGSAVATYVPMLKSNNNQEVNRAARALSFFANSELTFPLIDALVTEHKTTTPAGPAMQFGFGDNGNVGTQMGSKPKTTVTPKQNPAVLSVLKTIEPDVDYGYNETRWREHFARKLTAYDGDLRRDP